MRLHMYMHDIPRGDFAQGAFRCKRKFKGTLSNQSRQTYAAANSDLLRLCGGLRGEMPLLHFPPVPLATFGTRK